jgi:hypothetical protein
MKDEVIVFAQDEGEGSRGELTVLPDLQAAATFVELLLEQGVDPARIQVYRAEPLEVHINYKPVVSLTADAAGAAGFAGEEAAETPENREEETVSQSGVRFSSMFRSDTI